MRRHSPRRSPTTGTGVGGRDIRVERDRPLRDLRAALPERRRRQGAGLEHGGTAPIWSTDGSEIFYHDSQANLVAATFETDPSFRVTGRTSLFTVPQGFVGRGGTNSLITGLYDVAPDGRFLMMRPEGAPSGEADAEGDQSRVILVLNWFEELTRRVPTP